MGTHTHQKGRLLKKFRKLSTKLKPELINREI